MLFQFSSKRKVVYSEYIINFEFGMDDYDVKFRSIGLHSGIKIINQLG